MIIRRRIYRLQAMLGPTMVNVQDLTGAALTCASTASMNPDLDACAQHFESLAKTRRDDYERVVNEGGVAARDHDARLQAREAHL